MERCGKCPTCKNVERVKRQGLAALAHKAGNGEDVRIIWNTTLSENPCLMDIRYKPLAECTEAEVNLLAKYADYRHK